MSSLLSVPLRTVQVINVRWFNATAWYALKLACLLKKAGHEAHVAALAGTDTFRKAKDMGLAPVPLPLNSRNPLEYPRLWVKMGQLLQKVRPHIINCHRGEAFLFWAAFKKCGKYALVRTRGDQRLPRNNLPNRLLHTRMTNAVIATNSIMARHFTNDIGVPKERVHTVYGGVDTSMFHFDPVGRATVRARYGFADEHFVIGLLGRFDHVKAQKESILALARLIEQGRGQARLLLIGFPTAVSTETVRSWIRETGTDNHVVITGRVDDIPACLSALDIGIVPSLWSEAIARATLEMMACGLPLISTSVGVMPDLLPREALIPSVDGESPEQLADRLPDELAAMLHRAIASPEWLRHLTRINGERITTLRDEDFLRQTLAVYSQALAGNHGVW